MRDLDKALSDLRAIRGQIAAGTAFRGYGPATIALSGGLALVTASMQGLWLDDPTGQPLAYFAGWTLTALISAGIVLIEMRARSHRHHSGLADAMLHRAVEQFAPAAAAGVLLIAVLFQFAPEALWMVPGLWQLLVSLGIFASARALPGGVVLGGVWYFVAGFISLIQASHGHDLSPWLMGMPFGVGQLLMAAILHFASGDDDAEV